MIAGKRVVAVIQARMSSSRLPGKVLMPLAGRPLLAFMVDRVRRAQHIDSIVVATSTDPSDDPLAELLDTIGIACWRGSLENVLTRFYDAASDQKADIVLRLTGDCPLIEPQLIDACVEMLASQNLDYVSNVEPPRYPDGLDVEAMTMNALSLAEKEATLGSEREHVTIFIRNHPERFPRASLESAIDLSALRWTVDYADDLDMVRTMVNAISGDPILADRFDFLRVIDQLKLSDTGLAHARNEGLAKSLRED
jgi:spore coat polysaccharide biosynthesis protein SpsF